jgi:hypothetical protein
MLGRLRRMLVVVPFGNSWRSSTNSAAPWGVSPRCCGVWRGASKRTNPLRLSTATVGYLSLTGTRRRHLPGCMPRLAGRCGRLVRTNGPSRTRRGGRSERVVSGVVTTQRMPSFATTSPWRRLWPSCDSARTARLPTLTRFARST